VQHTLHWGDCQIPPLGAKPMRRGVNQRMQYTSASRLDRVEQVPHFLTCAGAGGHSRHGEQTNIGVRSPATHPNYIVNIYLLLYKLIFRCTWTASARHLSLLRATVFRRSPNWPSACWGLNGTLHRCMHIETRQLHDTIAGFSTKASDALVPADPRASLSSRALWPGHSGGDGRRCARPLRQ
jgi:hypothetical protein